MIKARILLILTISIVVILVFVLNTELLGENATYGECLVTIASNNRFSSSEDKSISESQCKKSCVWAGNNESNEKQNVSCKFQTISGYGWVASPEEFRHIIDKLSLNPLH